MFRGDVVMQRSQEKPGLAVKKLMIRLKGCRTRSSRLGLGNPGSFLCRKQIKLCAALCLAS